jgi:signal transduction histidine kinase
MANDSQSVVDAIPIRREPTDLRGLLHFALDVMQRQARACETTLSVTVEDAVPAVVSLDGSKIAWAVTALVGNALRYVHHGSHVRPGGSIAVRVTHDAAGREIAIEVQDNGAGMPFDKLRWLFNVGSAHPPLALGLSMVRDVVTGHGGRLDIQSETEPSRRGTTIRITLPVV